MKECKECCREITNEEFDSNNGLCKKCYKEEESLRKICNELEENVDKNSVNTNTYENDMNTYRKENVVSIILKIMSVICVIASVVLGLNQLNSLRTEELCGIYIVVGIVSAIFIYAFGEVVQLLEDIKNK